ncbi:hypothetical protein GGX14DRAFT_562158 [Mycena pura]|uniref:Uncharacterized protein n=1 Tax=Mycena pura TaxID=153505 RepID=A0AAD6VLQ4_9AGAR|nr:hypothetical protein GGX14DRAFT_562158 [Mycena pura]
MPFMVLENPQVLAIGDVIGLIFDYFVSVDQLFKDQPVTNPPTTAGAESLPTNILIAACVRYVKEYGFKFNRKFYKYNPVNRNRSTHTPDAK